jgi:hypothetical protein
MRRLHLMLGVAAAGSGMTVARVEVSAEEHRCGIDPLVNVCALRAPGRSFYTTESNWIRFSARSSASDSAMASASTRPVDLADLEPPAGSVDRAHGPRPPDWGEEKIAANGRPMPSGKMQG